MKKLVLVFILVTIPFYLFGQAQPQRQLQQQSYFVESEQPVIFISQEFKGSVSDVSQMMKEFMKNFFDQKLLPSGQPPMAIFYNAPRSSSDKELRIEVGLPVANRADVKSPLKIQELRLPPLMKHIHVGPYEGLFDAYAKLRGMAKNGNLEWSEQFVIHRFLDNPDFVRPENLRTEVLIPLAGNPPLKAEPSFQSGLSINNRWVYKQYRGSVAQLGDFVNDFMKSFFAMQLSPAGKPMVILSHIPKSQSDQKILMQVGYPVPANACSNAKLSKCSMKGQQIRFSNVAQQVHMGPYENLFETYNAMLRSIAGNGLKVNGPQAILVLENNPSLVKQEEIKADLILPVGKK